MFKTIEKTAHHIATVQDMLGVIMQEFLIRAQCHDRSKFTEDELTGYARFENMPEGLLYGSDEYKAEMAKIMEDNDCFKIHAGRNDHHPEFYDRPDLGYSLHNMGLFQLIEMVCDWAGATLSYGNKGGWMNSVNVNIQRYEFNAIQNSIIRETARFLEERVPDLREGEE